VHIREVIFLRMCVTDSYRVSASAYFGKRGVTEFSWYQSLGFRLAILIFLNFISRERPTSYW